MSAKVLFVDDDPIVLASFRRTLRKQFPVETVESGLEGLRAVRENGPFSVVVTDYCMPNMNGIEFLAQVRELAPETVRMLLTGSADLNAAIQAVNQGNIFRFLTKPCSGDELLRALASGVQEYRRIHKERKFNKRTRRLLAQAKEVQRNLMPADAPLEGLDIAGRSIFCDETGGDYYDFFEKGPSGHRRIGIAVGDVSDHGLPSALLMTTARAFLRECALRSGSVAEIVGSVNERLSRDIQTSGRFMTLFYAEIDRDTKSLRYVRAGHDPAMVFDRVAGGFSELNGRGGLPLGVFGEAVYEEYRHELREGEIIVIGTDGVFESADRKGCMFGKRRLQEVVAACAERPAAEIVDKALEDLKRFVHPLAMRDDSTLVVVKVGCGP
jgi:serine phosphatase RsbU (regulator of sigma subunit)